MQHNQAIFETLFNRDFSDTTNTDFLKEITAKHPYFSPAQFFLLEKIKEDKSLFEKQALTTNILFNNPYWLNFQLMQTGNTMKAEEIMPPVETVVPVPVPINEIPDDTDAPENTENELEPLNIELKMPLVQTALDETMTFEPMHMVDYFASQGIKLTEEVQTADKLGKQLKSFTEWLKTMKKIHVEAEAETTAETDTNIQALAENSNARAEVLTESMAEVFAKQGKIQKASEVYQKLSLLNPAKSTYFAAKIDNLKGI